ncbi:MAG TPA: 4Fe-4S dicluster domain-containing protein [bacterium]|nr:4Fe-4S dicluster domain-containing protein [bacterium]
MPTYHLSETELSSWVNAIMATQPVIGPVAKKSRFVFDRLEDSADLRLDYDTTILPPKKAFFPPKQDLLHFDASGVRGAIKPESKVLFGVHPYDIKAIHMLDVLFAEGHPDHAYLANREATTIIGSSVQNHYQHAFFGTASPSVPVQGHDAFLTKIPDGYTLDILSEKGRKLIEGQNFKPASAEQTAASEKVNEDAKANCPEKLTYTSEEIKAKLKASWDSPLWEEASQDCFSCGSCNTTCSTCYCFDVQDTWNIDQKSGKRYRRWDACMTTEFAEVSVQGGTENFRETKAARYRHRMMRKAAYLNDKLGGPACVGCGRCSGACTADIANPVNFIDKLMKS